ncbi:HAD-IA family hydrolase [Brevundimonas diminuta]|uniref:HAD-IA family hydrolase n=1 Tax=Brevundimonas diminuta TaxID=293 RepID=UPI003207A2A6
MSIERDLEGWTIAFDLDGTLVDSAPDLIGTLNRMLAQYELPPVPMSSTRHLVGHGAMAMLRHGFMEAGASWDEAHAPGLFERFIEDYTAHIADHSVVFDGCVAALDRLSARGAILCVATNKRTDLSVALIEALKLTHHFAFIAGPDVVSARKPSGAHIIEAVRKAGGDPARCVMVGDSTTDTKAAKDAGVPCIAVSFGYNDVPHAELGGDVMIDHYDEFEDALAGVMRA